MKTTEGQIHYVVGFAFARDKDEIVLMLKKKPEWQAGSFNGVGGKIDEKDADPVSAMVREFQEETGAITLPEMWQNYARLVFPEAVLHCFRMFSNVIYQCKTMEEEMVFIMPVKGVTDTTVIPNLKVLIPMALDEDFHFAEINAVVR